MSDAPEPITRWHQEPLAWLVIGIPLATIVACMAMIAIASRAPDGLVVDDYYKRGLEINKVIDRERRAAELGLSLRQVSLGSGRLEFDLAADSPAAAWKEALEVQLHHATRGDADQALVARHQGDGHYLALPAPVIGGPWYVDVSTPDWRLVKRVFIKAAN